MKDKIKDKVFRIGDRVKYRYCYPYDYGICEIVNRGTVRGVHISYKNIPIVLVECDCDASGMDFVSFTSDDPPFSGISLHLLNETEILEEKLQEKMRGTLSDIGEEIDKLENCEKDLKYTQEEFNAENGETWVKNERIKDCQVSILRCLDSIQDICDYYNDNIPQNCSISSKYESLLHIPSIKDRKDYDEFCAEISIIENGY